MGLPGSDGSPGAAGPGFFLGRMYALSGKPHEFGTPVGFNNVYEDEGLVTILSPGRTVTARGLGLRLTSPAGSGVSRAFVLRVNRADTSLGCTVSDSAQECDSGGAAITIPARSELSIAVETSGSSIRQHDALFSWEVS